MDKYLKLSLAAEPRRKGELEPHFWERASALQIFARVPLQFSDPLPTVRFLDRDPANHEPGVIPVYVPSVEALGMSSPGNGKGNGRDSAMGLGSRDLGGTMIPLFNGQLLLQVQTTAEFIPSRPTSVADSTEEGRTVSRGPSIRVTPGLPPKERRPAVNRRSSLPPMTSRDNVVVPENPSDPPLRVVVRAGTFDRLVNLLVFGLPGVTASIADDNGEAPLNERRVREVKVDRVEFSRVWWETFRSLLTPLVFFEVRNKTIAAEATALTGPSLLQSSCCGSGIWTHRMGRFASRGGVLKSFILSENG
jgi:GTPase-activating protein BEM2